MAVTGQVMVLFIIAHALGNSTIYFNWLNAYAEHLHDLPPLVWLYRIIMLTLFSVHVIIGIQLYLENRAAKPKAYAVQKRLSTTFAGKTMIWTGLLIASFLVYHLLHFTIQVINPEISAGANSDELQKFLYFIPVYFRHDRAGPPFDARHTKLFSDVGIE